MNHGHVHTHATELKKRRTECAAFLLCCMEFGLRQFGDDLEAAECVEVDFAD